MKEEEKKGFVDVGTLCKFKKRTFKLSGLAEEA
jgi:hypothetical protein